MTHDPSLLFRGYEIALKYALRGHRVEAGLQPSAAGARSAQEPLGLAGGKPLVDELGADAEAALQSLRETAGERADRMLGSIGVGGHADHHQQGPPLGDQALDRGKTRAVIRGRYGGERVGEPGLEVADGDAGAFRAEVECENGPRSRVTSDE